MKIRKQMSLICLLAAFACGILFSVPVRLEAKQSEDDRYQPGTCTKVDEEGEYQVAICEKVVTDGPCVDEVTCDGDELPSITF